MQPNIVAALRVKNEARWIAEVLWSLTWCNKIYVMDDHSDDGTAEIAKAAGAAVLHSPFTGLDEARDKGWLTQTIAEDQPHGTWVLMIDGDEVLERSGEETIWNSIVQNPAAEAFSLRVIYLWNSRGEMRVDGVYGRFCRPSLFRIGSKSLSFRQTKSEGHLHCSSVPLAYIGMCHPSPAALLHLGYLEREDRVRKWRYYNSIDPRNEAEGYDRAHPERGSYPHIVQGDIPQVPADARLKHAGPLEIRPLPEGLWP